MPTPNELPTTNTVQPSDALLVERAGALLRTEATAFTGPEGPPGEGVPAGGTTGQALVKNSNADYDTEWVNVDLTAPVTSVAGKTGAVTLDKNDVGLGNVDNTSDLNKPISTATQTALDGKVDENAAITPGTATKITYDAKGLVTAGTNATTTDITEGSNLYFTNSRARSAISAGTGISYDSGTGVVSCTITQYTDAQARSSLSAGTGISYNSLTGVITSTITQYTDAQARASLSAGTGISYVPATGVISSTITQYTDENAQDAVGAMINSTLTYVDATPSLGINLSNQNSWLARQIFLDVVEVEAIEARTSLGVVFTDDNSIAQAQFGSSLSGYGLVMYTPSFFQADVDLASTIRYSSVSSVSNIATSQNNWTPTGAGFASVFRVNQTTSSINITGFNNNDAARIIYIMNIGTQALTFTNEDVASTAANRFALGANFALNPGNTLGLWYDPTSARWRPMHPLATGGGGGGTPGEVKNQLFLAGANFTAGTTTTLTLTTTPIAPSSASLAVYFDAGRQLPSEWSYDPGTGIITFTSAIPVGTQAVFCEWQSVSIPVGTPSDGTVSWSKLASGLVASVADMLAGVADKIISAANFKSYVDTYLGIKLQSSVATTSGTSISLPNIPSWAKQIIITFDGVSTNGTTGIFVRLADAGGEEATGYNAIYTFGGASSISHTAYTTGYGVAFGAATATYIGRIVLDKHSGNTWIATGQFMRGDGTNNSGWIYGTKTLSDTLTQINLVTQNGTDTFDAGSVAYRWIG